MTDHHGGEQRKLKGIAGSPGIIIGKARLVDRSKVKVLYQYITDDDQVNREAERLKEAFRATHEQLTTLKNRMPKQVKEHAFILDSHLMILKDSMLSDSTVRRVLDEKINAEWALEKSVAEIGKLFKQIDDEYISSRIEDVENVAQRILWNLSGETHRSLADITERAIIVAHDLSPADTTELNTSKVIGFLTDLGGRTSHAAIMAQGLQIPVIVGLETITEQVKDEDLLIVDGNTGVVIIDPDDYTIIRYQDKQLQYEEYKSNITRTSYLPAVTIDGHKICIKANIEFLEEVVAVKDYGAEGIGLYRTEFLYLKNKGLPSEAELFDDYREVAEIIAPAPVTLRTVDLGGDKLIPEFEITKEMNPALGMRAIRYCLREQKVFKRQLRAILRASIYGNVQLMFPMISGLQEILDAKEILEQARNELTVEKIDYDHNMKIGIMIEIPSAVTMAEELAGHVDFFSIGTNDLIQYALAIDRVNEHVAYMFQPFHPAIIRMIQQVVIAAKKANIGVSLCGEMAGDPLCVSMLLGLGIEELSMNARAIPLIKSIIRSISAEQARNDFKEIISLSTAKDVQVYVSDRIKSRFPELEQEGYLAA